MKPKLTDEMEYVIEPQVRQLCGPLFFSTSLANVLDITNNGSFGLVDTGSKRILVTCSHVWEGFQAERQKSPELNMLIWLGGPEAVAFSPAAPIAHDREYDLATFDMQPFLTSCQHRRFYPLHQNPPRKVKIGDAIFFIGFPGSLRGIRGKDNKWMFGRAPFGMVVREVSADGTHFFVDISKLLISQSPDQLGGISGCPCFLVRKGRGQAELVGFATAIIQGTYLRFTHASCLARDGTFIERKSTWNWIKLER